MTKPDARQLLLHGLEKAWEKYLTELKHCRQEFSNEAVHDLRVATRRLMAIMQLLYSIAPRPRLKRIVRTLKHQLDEFDDLRDTQVILVEISKTVQELPELNKFLERQNRREEKLLRTLKTRIKKFDIRQLSKWIGKTQDSLVVEAADDLEEQILLAVDESYLNTKQRFSWVDLEQPATIHRVRITFKKFRYMVEVIYPLLKEFPETNLKEMHNYQSLMGEVQDAEIFMQTLTDVSEQASFSDPGPISEYYERRRSEAISAYAHNMNQIHGFWRAGLGQAFPWEKSNR